MDHEGFGYGEFSPQTHELVGLQSGMEMLGIPAKSPDAAWQPHQSSWILPLNRIMPEDNSSHMFRLEQANHTEELSLSLCNTDNVGFHQDQRFFSSTQPGSQYQLQLKTCKYLAPAQELLNEFCSLGAGIAGRKQGKPVDAASYSQSLSSLDLPELQKRKSRLLSMLEEVDRRYRKYCEQMRAVVSSFESVAGEGAATVYSNLASKAMSRHFRCMRDGIVGQIKATKKAMGEKDPTGAGSSRGETPKLKMLDQSLRQQKAFQQAGLMESHPWRPQRGLPERSVTVLRAWLFEHFLHPYPSDVDKHILARQTGLSRSQVSNWFINARVRLWKPMVEEMYVEETKEQDSNSQFSPNATLGHDDNISASGGSGPIQLLADSNPNPNSQLLQAEDQKPAPGQLLLNDSDSLSSIVNSRHRYKEMSQPQMTDMDFSAYNDCSGTQSFGSGVSLTLGLQQHSGGGMSLSFSPSAQNSLFFGSRENMDDCQPVQFLDGDQAQTLPYRNLMGGQLLHDLAG
nr:homeobox protein BEL1 like protein [Lilium longiflorum x Lilium hybrid division I]